MIVRCDERCRTRKYRPRARGWPHLRVGPSSAYARATYSSSIGSCRFASALATAESSTFSTSPAASFSHSCSTRSASSAERPRMSDSTCRTLYGDTRRCFTPARTVGVVNVSLLMRLRPPALQHARRRRVRSGPHLRSAPGPLAATRSLLARVEAERTGGRELTELVADHRLGHVDGDVLAAVVHRDGVAHHLGRDGRATRPRLDHSLVTGLVHALDLDPEVVVDERSLLQAARHVPLPPCAARTPPADDQLVGRLPLLAGAPLGLAPRRHRVPTAGALALATTERVVDGVHRDTAGVRPLALPACPARLPDGDQARFAVADRTDRRAAVDRDAAHLRGREAQRRELAFLRDELDRGTGTAAELGARTGLELDVVHRRTDGDVPQRQRVAGADLRALAALQHVADRDTGGGDDVALLAVAVVQQRDARVAVRVVLDRRDLGGDTVLVALEVDDAVALLVTAAAVTRRHAAVRVAATRLRLRLRE